MHVCTHVRTYARQSSILQSPNDSFENSVQRECYSKPIFVNLAPSLLFTTNAAELRSFEAEQH